MPAKPKAKASPTRHKTEELDPKYVFVRLDSIDNLANRCQSAIRRATGVSWASFKKVSATKSRKNLLELTGIGITKAIADGQEHSVVPLVTIRPTDVTPGPQYWVASKLEYDSEPKSKALCLISIQLFIFQGGLANEDEKRALIRIEWDCREGYLLDPHAQPHWHVYSSILTPSEEDFDSSDLSEEDVMLDFETSSFDDVTLSLQTDLEDNSAWPGGARFHFALAADWQKPLTSPSYQNHELKIEQLGNWIERCLTYVKEQLEYIDEKTILRKKGLGLSADPK